MDNYKKYKVLVFETGKEQWYLNGRLHREDGPAVITSNGDKFWYLNGRLHREDGPAVIYPNGDTEYWLNGKKYLDKKQWQERLKMEESKEELKTYLKKMLSYLEG